MIADVQNSKTPDLAVVDIGSSAVRLALFCGDEKLQVLREMCALGKTLEQDGRLWPQGVEKAMAAFRSFRKTIDAYPGLPVIVTATAALRDAQDGADFAARVKKETGFDIRVLDGGDEARISALGVLAGGLGRTAVIGDLGGGSLELTRTKDGKIAEGVSFPLGTRRLQAASDASDMIAQTLDIPAGFSGLEFVALGGSWRALAEAHKRRHESAGEDIHGCAFSPQELIAFCDWVTGQDRAALEDLLKDSARGSDGIRNGALLMKVLLQKLECPKVVFSATGLREGLVAEFRKRP